MGRSRLDLRGVRFGDLEGVEPVSFRYDTNQTGWRWKMRCLKIRPDGKVCGQVRIVLGKHAGRYFACKACTKSAKKKHSSSESKARISHPGMGRPNPRRPVVTQKNFQGILDGFNESEKQLYRQYLGKRNVKGMKGVQNKIGCVELVLLDRLAQKREETRGERKSPCQVT